MATKYHIDKNGKPAICRATKRPCPLGGDEVHFDTVEDAQEYADKENAKEFGVISDNNELSPFEYEMEILNRLTDLRGRNGGNNYAMKCRSCKRIDNLDKDYGNTIHMDRDRTAREDRIIRDYGEGELMGTYVVDHQMGPSNRYRKQIAELYDNGRLEIFDYHDKKRVTTFMTHGTRAEAMTLMAGELVDREKFDKMTEAHNEQARLYGNPNYRNRRPRR